MDLHIVTGKALLYMKLFRSSPHYCTYILSICFGLIGHLQVCNSVLQCHIATATSAGSLGSCCSVVHGFSPWRLNLLSFRREEVVCEKQATITVPL
jgi:hypothetical protein